MNTIIRSIIFFILNKIPGFSVLFPQAVKQEGITLFRSEHSISSVVLSNMHTSSAIGDKRVLQLHEQLAYVVTEPSDGTQLSLAQTTPGTIESIGEPTHVILSDIVTLNLIDKKSVELGVLDLKYQVTLESIEALSDANNISQKLYNYRVKTEAI